MDDRRQIEEAVRAYLEARDDERAELATGELAEFLELIGDVEDPSRLVEESVTIRQLEVVEIEGDEATVDLDAMHRYVVEAPEAGRVKHGTHFSGPVTVRRVGGSWRVADLVRNGRFRSASLRLHPSGTQEVNGAQISALAVDLLSDVTLLYLRVENRRDAPVQVGWTALGIPRRRGWKYVALDVRPLGFAPGTTTFAFAWAWKALPLETQAFRLIVVEKRRRVGFDLVIDPRRNEALGQPQPPPRTLPLRLRLGRSPLGLVPALVPLVFAYLFGSWPAVALVLAGFGAIVLLSIPWHRLRGRRLPVRRPALVGSGLLTVGTIVFVLSGIFAGCPARSEAAETSDRFVTALLTGGPEATDRYLASSTPPFHRSELPFVPIVSDGRAARLVKTGAMGTKEECIIQVFGGADADDPCFIYELPDRSLTVFMTCEYGEWKVNGAG
jgi:hypothetical protein